MRLLVILLLFHFPSSAESLYDWTKKRFQEIFQVEYKDDIVLTAVHKVPDWDTVHSINSDYVAGTFTSMKDKFTNIIWVRTPLPPAYVQHIMNYDKFYEPSTLVHEYAHFFSKKAGWNELYWSGLSFAFYLEMSLVFIIGSFQTFFYFLSFKYGTIFNNF